MVMNKRYHISITLMLVGMLLIVYLIRYYLRGYLIEVTLVNLILDNWKQIEGCLRPFIFSAPGYIIPLLVFGIIGNIVAYIMKTPYPTRHFIIVLITYEIGSDIYFHLENNMEISYSVRYWILFLTRVVLAVAVIYYFSKLMNRIMNRTISFFKTRKEESEIKTT